MAIAVAACQQSDPADLGGGRADAEVDQGTDVARTEDADEPDARTAPDTGSDARQMMDVADSSPSVDASADAPNADADSDAPTDAAPDADTGAPPSFAANEPAGLIEVLDYNYTGSYNGGGTTDLDGTGISITDFGGLPGDRCRIMPAQDSVAGSSPYGSQVWESHYGIGHGGTGPCNQSLDLGGSYDLVHVTVAVFWEENWEVNTTSEKFLWVNIPALLLQWLYTDLVVFNVQSATGCSELEVNAANTPLAGRSAPCDQQQTWGLIDGQWTVIEFQLEQVDSNDDGTIRVWQDGTLVMEHSGRTFDQAADISLWDTWGGGGSLSKEQSKLIGRWRIARSAQ